jgi:hypothetical protein
MVTDQQTWMILLQTLEGMGLRIVGEDLSTGMISLQVPPLNTYHTG